MARYYEDDQMRTGSSRGSMGRMDNDYDRSDMGNRSDGMGGYDRSGGGSYGRDFGSDQGYGRSMSQGGYGDRGYSSSQGGYGSSRMRSGDMGGYERSGSDRGYGDPNYGNRSYGGQNYGGQGYDDRGYSDRDYGSGRMRSGGMGSSDYNSRDDSGMNAGRSGGVGYGSDRGPHSGRGPEGYSRSSDRITEDVNEALTDHGGVDASKVRVSVEDGEVTLEGTVSSRRAKRMAEDAAESARGVRDVHNRLTISDDDSGDGAASGSDGEQATASGKKARKAAASS